MSLTLAFAGWGDSLSISLDENGHSTVVYTPNSGPQVTIGSSSSPVVGGGVAYTLGFAPFPGVVEVTDPSGAVSDVLDFWNTGSPLSGFGFTFYSSGAGGIDSPADVSDLPGLLSIIVADHAAAHDGPPVVIPETTLAGGIIGAVYGGTLAGEPGNLDAPRDPALIHALRSSATYTLVSAVPEPSSLLLLGTLILGLALCFRKSVKGVRTNI